MEQDYYDMPEHWSPEHWNLLESRRARLAIQWLPPNSESVLDVGCGNGILANLLTDLGLVVGVDRSVAALTYVHGLRCRGDASHLPFSNDVFDVVACMEAIEHLPTSVLKAALAEMARVARNHILITVPYRENLEWSRVTCPECGCRFHRNYHMRSFDLTNLQNLFQDWESIVLSKVSGVFPRQVPVFPDFRRKIAVHRHGTPFPRRTMCPQCGHSGSKSLHKRVDLGQRNTSYLRSLVRSVWPKTTTYILWMALYAKRSKLSSLP
jgi:SAM-dependent methyltransferase